MPNAEVFLDANILLYACSFAPEDASKQKCADDLIQNTSFGISAQVIQEFLANALRKKSLGITETQIDATLELASHVTVQPVTLKLICDGVTLRRRFQLSHWDSTIVAAAIALGCRILYSEDFQHGATYEGLRVINPFLSP
ncbi:MAG: PIN domain-containing protein [Verrucomicrobiales bacterium]